MHEKPHGSILRRAGPLMLARLGVAGFTFAIPMVLARVLLPESYGTFKQAWLLSNTLVLVLPLGLNQSLVYFVPREPWSPPPCCWAWVRSSPRRSTIPS